MSSKPLMERIRHNPVYRAARHSFRRYYPCVVQDRSQDRNVVVVAGKGRSGTTWLADIINCRRDHRYLFEPFNLSSRFRGHPLCTGPDENRGYTRPRELCPERFEVAEAILMGRSGDSGPESRNRRLFFRRRLIKEITCTLYLRWLVQQFPRYRYVLIVRNPFATAISQARHHWSRASVKDYETDHALVADHLANHLALIAEYDHASPFERAVLSWAIAHWVLRRQGIGNHCLTVSYEHLTRDPQYLACVFDYLGRTEHPAALQSWRNPSATAWTGKASSANSLNGGATDEEIRQARRILDRFELDDIYSEAGEPQCNVWLTSNAVEDSFADVL